jgi:hypothetical protein
MAIVIRANPAVFQARKNMRIQQDLMEHVLRRLERHNALQKGEGSHLLREASRSPLQREAAAVPNAQLRGLPGSVDGRDGASRGVDAAGEFAAPLAPFTPLAEEFDNAQDSRIVLLEEFEDKMLGGPRGVGFGTSQQQAVQSVLGRSSDVALKEDIRTLTLRDRRLNEKLSALESADQHLEKVTHVVSRMRETLNQAVTSEISAHRQTHLRALHEELANILNSTEYAFAAGVLGLTDPELLEREEAMAEARLDEAMGIVHTSRGTIAASKFDVDVAIRDQRAAPTPGEANTRFEDVAQSALAAQGVAEQIRKQPEVATLSQANGLSTAAMRLLG